MTALIAIIFLLSIGLWLSIIFGPLLLLAVALPAAQASLSANRSRFTSDPKTWRQRHKMMAVTALLHMLQPLVRLNGRLSQGLTPWRRRGMRTRVQLLPMTMKLWREKWEDPVETLKKLQARLRKAGAVVIVGSEFDHWDFEIRGGLLGSARLMLLTEEHGTGKQFLRFRILPKYSRLAFTLIILLGLMLIASGMAGAWIPSIVSGLIATLITFHAITESGSASGIACDLLKQFGAL